MQEATFWATPFALKDLFSTIIIFCEVADPVSLWEKFWQPMSEDIAHCLQRIYNLQHYQVPEEQIKDQTLSTIKLLFKANGTLVTQFNLPLPTSNIYYSSVDRLLMEELEYNINYLKVEHEKLFTQLNAEQNDAYDKVLEAVVTGNDGFFFVNGHGGTRKTFLWEQL